MECHGSGKGKGNVADNSGEPSSVAGGSSDTYVVTSGGRRIKLTTNCRYMEPWDTVWYKWFQVFLLSSRPEKWREDPSDRAFVWIIR